MSEITVFLDNEGIPMGTCPKGSESEWLNSMNGSSSHADFVPKQIHTNVDEWETWSRFNARNMKNGKSMKWV